MKFNIPKVELSLFNKKIQDEIKALPETVEVPDIGALPEEFSEKFTTVKPNLSAFVVIPLS